MAELPEDKCWLAVAPSFNHFAVHSRVVQCKCCYCTARISSTRLTLKMQEDNLPCYSVHKGWKVRAIFCWKQCILLKLPTIQCILL